MITQPASTHVVPVEDRPLRVVGISLGSSSRDFRVELTVKGRRVIVERIGTDGDFARFRSRLREMDGQVDVIGIGGANLALEAAGRRYPIRDIARMTQGLHTPVVDGSGVMESVERQLILESLPREHGISLQGRRVLLVSSVGRYAMAEALTRAGADVRFGDLMFALGIPILLRGLRTVDVLGILLLPIFTRIPFKWLYPTGAAQEKVTPKFGSAYAWAEVLAGDFHFIHQHMPDDLRGKIVLTNTLTSRDVEELRRRGVSVIVTASPDLEGRSFGANVVQAILVAVSGRRPEQLTSDDYLALMRDAGLAPRVERLNP